MFRLCVSSYLIWPGLRGHDEHFCFRVKIIADELCNNAIQHGAQEIDSEVKISAEVSEENLILSVQDEGGSRSNLEKLKRAVTKTGDDTPQSPMRGRGLEIVQMLGDRLEISVDQKGFTEVKAVKEQSLSKPQEQS